MGSMASDREREDGWAGQGGCGGAGLGGGEALLDDAADEIRAVVVLLQLPRPEAGGLPRGRGGAVGLLDFHARARSDESQSKQSRARLAGFLPTVG